MSEHNRRTVKLAGLIRQFGRQLRASTCEATQAFVSALSESGFNFQLPSANLQIKDAEGWVARIQELQAEVDRIDNAISNSETPRSELMALIGQREELLRKIAGAKIQLGKFSKQATLVVDEAMLSESVSGEVTSDMLVETTEAPVETAQPARSRRR